MGIVVWFSLFKFNWLRRCKMCGVRGSKCLCRRPSLALEHIFFLEERKNKFFARNFSHVSDTMVTSNSTNSLNGAYPSSNCSSAPVVMRGAGSFLNSELNPTDYYCQSAPPPPIASDSSGELLPRMENKTETQLRANGRRNLNQCRNTNVSATVDVSTTTLVHKCSRRTMSKSRRNGDKNMQPPIMTAWQRDGNVLCCQEPKQIVPPNRRQSRTSAKMTNTRPQHKGEAGVSFQFYGRSGNGVSASPVPTLLLSTASMSSCSTNDSFMMGSSSISSMRVSQFSDRVSLEANFGSFNPQSYMSNTGCLIESGHALSIKEDDEAQALEKLTGWFHASSVSTQDSFMLSR